MKVKTESVNVAPSAERHFYAFCVYGWSVAESADEAAVKLHSNLGYLGDVDAWVIEVKLPITATYDISNFVPVVDEDLLEYVVEGKLKEFDNISERSD